MGGDPFQRSHDSRRDGTSTVNTLPECASAARPNDGVAVGCRMKMRLGRGP